MQSVLHFWPIVGWARTGNGPFLLCWVVEKPDRILAGIAGRRNKLIKDYLAFALKMLLDTGERSARPILVSFDNASVTSFLHPPLCRKTVPWVTLLVRQLCCQSKIFGEAMRRVRVIAGRRALPPGDHIPPLAGRRCDSFLQ